MGERAQFAAKTKLRPKAPTFAECADKYIEAHRAGWKNAKHIDQWESTLRSYAGPVIGKKPVDQIAVEDVLKILQPIWSAKPETASRLRGRIEKVLGWATAMKYRTGDNPAAWSGALSHLLPAISKVQKIEHHKAVPYAEVPALMKQLISNDSISAKALGSIHMKAMPVILTTPDEVETWLTAQWAEASKLQRPLPNGVLKIVAVGPRKMGAPSL